MHSFCTRCLDRLNSTIFSWQKMCDRRSQNEVLKLLSPISELSSDLQQTVSLFLLFTSVWIVWCQPLQSSASRFQLPMSKRSLLQKFMKRSAEPPIGRCTSLAHRTWYLFWYTTVMQDPVTKDDDVCPSMLMLVVVGSGEVCFRGGFSVWHISSNFRFRKGKY